VWGLSRFANHSTSGGISPKPWNWGAAQAFALRFQGNAQGFVVFRVLNHSSPVLVLITRFIRSTLAGGKWGFPG
jgi:hypothetical protein